jgi:hypothetical protein
MPHNSKEYVRFQKAPEIIELPKIPNSIDTLIIGAGLAGVYTANKFPMRVLCITSGKICNLWWSLAN